jgi:hypothetical protein
LQKKSPAGVIASGVFLFLVVFFLISNFLYSYYLKRYYDGTDFSDSISYPAESILPGHKFSVYLNMNLPYFFIPGVTVVFNQILDFAGRREIDIKAGMGSGRNKFKIQVGGAPRGSYSATTAQFVVVDVLGFSRSFVSIPLRKEIRIYPEQTFLNKRISYSGSGGSKLINSNEIYKSDELTDVRKYYQGDDPRKINWKIFAASSELYVSKEDIESRPDSLAYYILNIDLCDVPSSADDRAGYIDRVVELFASLVVTAVAESGFACVILPGKEQVVYTEKNINKFLGALSSIWWNSSGANLSLSSLKNSDLYIVSMPGSTRLYDIVSQVKSDRNRVNLLFKDYYHRVRARRFFSIRDFFFYNNSKTAVFGNVEKYKAVQKKIDRDISMFSSMEGVNAERF